MTHSLVQSNILTCADCKQDSNAEIWLVVDAEERPDLLDRIRAGTLHTFPCPHCRSTGEVDAPLLLYRPGADPTLIFCPTSEVLYDDEEEDSDEMDEQADKLFLFLQEALGSVWQEEWADDVAVVPIFMLSVTLSEDPDAAMKQMAEHMMERLEQLQEEDPEAFREITETAMELAAELEGIITPEQLGAFRSPLVPVLEGFLSGESWEESYEFVKVHPELLDEEADKVLVTIIQTAHQDGDTEMAEYWEEHLLLLRHCRKVGVEKAFADKMD